MKNILKLSKSAKNYTIDGVSFSNYDHLGNQIFPKFLEKFGNIECTFESCQQFLSSNTYKEIEEKNNQEIAIRANAANIKAKEMAAVENNIENATAEEILNYISYNKMNGWACCEILTGKNALANKILAHFKGSSFTATPFDDGQIFVKSSNGNRLTLMRHAKFDTIWSILI
jgi:hypothetical protein